MIEPHKFNANAQLVIGSNERSILQSATDKIDDPSNTQVGMILLAQKSVQKIEFTSDLFDMSEIDFIRHKKNLMSEMDEAIKAALVK